MNKHWTILTNRRGMEVHDPCGATLESAIADLLRHQNGEGGSSIVLRRGIAGGQVHVLELFGSCAMTFSHYADCNFEQCLVELCAGMLRQDEVKRRFQLLSDGQTEALARCTWGRSQIGMDHLSSTSR